MQRIANYGSFLQAYGLKKTIEELGYEVEFVDYDYEKPIITSKKNEKNIIKKIISKKGIIKRLKTKIGWIKFQKKYKIFLLKHLNITDKKNLQPKNIDCLIIGSDEVFNCLQGYPVGYSRELFGYHYEGMKVLSYAASFGFSKLELLKEYGVDREISNMLNRFEAISVRDKNSFEIVSELTTGKNIEEHLDPVIISNYTDEVEINLSNYIIVYTYPGRLTEEEEKYIKAFSKKYNKKIVSLGFYQNIADLNLYVDPLEILSYFKNADYVITDTFHGTIFSIKTNSKFCTIIRDSNKNKLQDLLIKLKQEDRKVVELPDIESKYQKECDFSVTNLIMEEERKRSIEYLRNIIGE